MTLRWRLTFWYMLLAAGGMLTLILISYKILGDTLLSEIDQTLVERAKHVVDAVAVIPNRPIQGISMETTDEFRSPGVYLQILNTDGMVVAHSYNLGSQQLPLDSADLERGVKGKSFYLTLQISGQDVRVYHQPLRRENEIVGIVQVGQSLAGLETTMRNLRAIYSTGTVAVLLFSLAGGWWLTNTGLRPLSRVTQTAHGIAQAEDLALRVQYSGPDDEIGTLVSTFNRMLDRLQALFESQSRFLAEAAHELRTPLSTLLGNLDLLVQFGERKARREEILGALKRTGRDVTRILEDLLLLGQAEAGWHLRRYPVAIDDIFLEVYETARMTTSEVGLQIHTCEPAWVHGDPDRLRQVFNNLIDNAVKYSPEGGRITLDLWRERGKVWIRVIDTGSGIPPEALPRVFDPFFRVQREGTQAGVGLGLAIVSWIVKEHDGEITIDSIPDSGTTVTVSLPEVPPEVSQPT